MEEIFDSEGFVRVEYIQEFFEEISFIIDPMNDLYPSSSIVYDQIIDENDYPIPLTPRIALKYNVLKETDLTEFQRNHMDDFCVADYNYCYNHVSYECRNAVRDRLDELGIKVYEPLFFWDVDWRNSSSDENHIFKKEYIKDYFRNYDRIRSGDKLRKEAFEHGFVPMTPRMAVEFGIDTFDKLTDFYKNNFDEFCYHCVYYKHVTIEQLEIIRQEAIKRDIL